MKTDMFIPEIIPTTRSSTELPVATQIFVVSTVARLGKYQTFAIASQALLLATRRVPAFLATNWPHGKTNS
jgi:hypothetical protein